MDEAGDVWDDVEYNQNIKKARQNLDAAKILIEQRFISLSAFHVQQCVELAIKAVAYKVGFKVNLEKTRTTRSHIPAKGLISEVYCFAVDQLKQIDQTKFNQEFNSSISEAMDRFEQIIGLLSKIEKKDKEKFTELWLHSLGINTSERIVTALDSYKKSFDTKLAQQLITGTLLLVREFRVKIIKFIRKNRQVHVIESAKKATREMISKHGLSVELVDAFFDTECEFKKIISNEIDRHGPIKMMDLILKPNGLLDEFKDIQRPKSIKLDISECVKFIWMAYLSTISPTVILLYPHAFVARYPRTVSVKIQNSKTISKHTT